MTALILYYAKQPSPANILAAISFVVIIMLLMMIMLMMTTVKQMAV